MANPEVAYEHTGTASPTELAAPLTNVATSITVADGTGYPTGAGGNFYITIDRLGANYERILCSGRVGNVITVASSGRGVDGTVAQSHLLGATVEHTWSAVEANQLSAHISAVNGVHGVVGDLVGTSDAQTLTNKTLTTPTIGSLTNAQHDHSNAAGGGAVPQASITGLVAALAALTAEDALKQNLAEKGLANGYASLNASTKVPFAQLPSGTGGSEVAVGNHTHAYSADDHTHTINAVTRTYGLTERTFSDGDPAKTLASLALTAGKYLIIGQCKGLTAASDTLTGFQYDITQSGGTLLWCSVVTFRKASTGIGEGCHIQAYFETSGAATVNLTGEKLGSGALLTNSTLGQLIAIPLDVLPID